MNIAITGATGFIGKRLVQRCLSAGHEVRVLTRNKRVKELFPGASICVGDLSQDDAVIEDFLVGTDLVYHLAAELNDEKKMQAVNIDGTARLLDASHGKVKFWVQLSSTGVYGPQRGKIVTEETPFNPTNLYEQSKAKADILVQKYSLDYGMKTTFIRPSNVYGPDMPNQSLFQLISVIERGLFFYVGQRGATMNYIHVDNVVDALMLCLTSNAGQQSQEFIISDYAPIEQLVGTVACVLGISSPVLRFPENVVRLLAKLCERIPGIPLKASRVDAVTGTVVYSSDLIMHRLGYAHRISIYEGFAELAQTYKGRI